jgi:hypothetical protein
MALPYNGTIPAVLPIASGLPETGMRSWNSSKGPPAQDPHKSFPAVTVDMARRIDQHLSMPPSQEGE